MNRKSSADQRTAADPAALRGAREDRICHAFTVDVEDWYQAIPARAPTRAAGAHRLHASMDRLLTTLDEAGVTATFYWLGPSAAEYPGLLRQTADLGHETGCHGWSHDLLYTMGRGRFREETSRATQVISSITGTAVTSYRAAYFSITRASMWALEVLAELGFTHDSSIFPVHNWRYGIPGFRREPHRLHTAAGPIDEFPISVRRVLGRDIPLTGGAYFRIYPYSLTRANLRAIESNDRAAVFYIHPWELDPEHPRVSFHWKPWLTHYARLRSAGPKLRRLLRDFRFGTLTEAWNAEYARSR